ncbi:MAG: hypothetical protein RIS84_710 [Pseudomonadota bacterium]|jgi:PQQ-dependent catabolism-associated CXXCW motif protein
MNLSFTLRKCLFLLVLFQGANALEIPTGYRLEHYRAPTPDSVEGAKTINTKELQALIAKTTPPPILIDVLAITRRPESEELDSSWLPTKPRYNLPQSIWLPNIGYGTLDAEMESYFRDNLAKATAQNKQRALVFYCIADCWMSWNACKRAASWGYQQIYWYKEGTDGWEQAGLPTENSIPIPLKPH